MKVFIDNENKSIEIQKLLIEVGDSEFRISINKFGELVLNKQYYGNDSNTEITIKPSVSNEIRIV